MELARIRRLAGLFAALGFLMPYAPKIFLLPRVPGSCLGQRYGDAQCMMFALGSMGLALAFACFGARDVAPRPYWTRVAAVGFGWAAAGMLLPL